MEGRERNCEEDGANTIKHHHLCAHAKFISTRVFSPVRVGNLHFVFIFAPSLPRPLLFLFCISSVSARVYTVHLHPLNIFVAFVPLCSLPIFLINEFVDADAGTYVVHIRASHLDTNAV